MTNFINSCNSASSLFALVLVLLAYFITNVLNIASRTLYTKEHTALGQVLECATKIFKVLTTILYISFCVLCVVKILYFVGII